jgi:hypothetical protein
MSEHFYKVSLFRESAEWKQKRQKLTVRVNEIQFLGLSGPASKTLSE